MDAHRPATRTAVGKNCQLGQIGKHRLVAFVEPQVNGFPLVLNGTARASDTQNTPPESPPARVQGCGHVFVPCVEVKSPVFDIKLRGYSKGNCVAASGPSITDIVFVLVPAQLNYQ